MFSTSFPEKSVISRITAKMLIEVEAVRFSAKEPFKFTSGWASPVYICLLYTSPSPRDKRQSRMPSSA